MPILNVKGNGTKSGEMTKRISSILLDLTGRILRKVPKVTSIAIEYVDPQDWIVAGKSLAEQGKSSFDFNIKITDEANSKAEMAQYIGEAFEAFARLLGSSATCMKRATSTCRTSDEHAYGYAGRTQEYRYHYA